MDMNVFAKQNDLAVKFGAAIQTIENGKGWEVFKGLDKGETTVKVVYDGEIRFLPIKKKKAPKPKKVKPKDKEPEPSPEAEPVFSSAPGTFDFICLNCGGPRWIGEDCKNCGDKY